MAGQVIIGSVRNAPQLAPAEREFIFDICCTLAVVRQFFRRVISQTDCILCHIQAQQEVFAVFSPVIQPFQICTGFAEEFQLHLFKFSGTEGEVTGCDFVTEGFTNLTDTEGQFFSCGSLHIFEVYEDTLCGFGTQINHVFRILCYALEGLEHQVKLTDICEVMRAAGRACNLIIVYEFLHFFICPAVYNHFGHIMGCHVVFNQLIGAETLLTFLTVHQRVGEAANVTGCHPCLGVHQDCTVNADILGVFLNKFLPPCFFHVVFQLYTQRAIIPCVCQTAVNFGTGVNKASVFCQCYDFFHRFYCHLNSSLFLWDSPMYLARDE